MFDNKVLRYTMFGLLYFTQGTVLSYFTALNALYFLSKGLSMTDVGIFASIALIPFVLKIFLGIWSDRVNLFGKGHRKPYILIGLTVQTFCLLLAPFIDPKQYYWGFVVLAFVLQMGMALYDTCTDGLALDTTPDEEEGIIQGFMVGGRALGVVVTASVVGLLAENVSWLAVFWVLAALTILPIPLVLMSREPDKTSGERFTWQAFGAFKQGPVIAASIVGLIVFMVIVGANQLVNPFLEEKLKISLSTAGFITTLWGIGAVAGGAVGGSLMRRLGGRGSVLAGLGLSSLALLVLAFFIQPRYGLPLAVAMVAFFGLAYGTYQTVYFALAMRYTDPRIAASMFAILMAFTNVGQGIGLGLGGTLADGIGFMWTFVAFAGINFLILPFLPLMFRKEQVGQV